MSDIFISYARENKVMAERLAQALMREHLSVWWDTVIPPGRSYNQVIQDALDSAKCVVVLWSKLSVTSDWVNQEADEGKRRGILIPALIEDVIPPLGYRHIQSANLVGWQGSSESAEFRQLFAAIKVHMQHESGSSQLVWAPEFEKPSESHPWVNSLGMRFVPVAHTNELFSIWDTRVQDFSAFVEETAYDATGGMYALGTDGWKLRRRSWEDPEFDQGSTHPVVGTSWEDAKAFCAWLTKIEHTKGTLPNGYAYRLPTDREWSVAVGLPGESGNSPEEKNLRVIQYPWGEEWPPPAGVGNYSGVESRIGNEPPDWAVIEGYNDGYPRTSPVGHFSANPNGLYDMGGNVWQWCEDWYNSEKKDHVLRGASWYFSTPGILNASARGGGKPSDRGDHIGFRCVVARSFPE